VKRWLETEMRWKLAVWDFLADNAIPIAAALAIWLLMLWIWRRYTRTL
jgi:hypothetical protein